jgi:hypothetical protein
MTASSPPVVILSYPKTGRTWLRVMIGKYLCDRYAISQESYLVTPEMTAKAGLPHVLFSHGKGAFRHYIHYTQLQADKSHLSRKKVMLLGRGIHDSLVSAWLHLSRRDGVFAGGLGEFVRDGYYGAPKFLTYYRQWHENQRAPLAFRFLRYEDMHADPEATLRACLEYIGITEIDRDLLRAAVQYGSFDNLKRIEDESPAMVGRDGRNIEHPESRKIRRGKIGGYVDYMRPEEIAWVDELNRTLGCEFTRPRETPSAPPPRPASPDSAGARAACGRARAGSRS